MTPRLLSTEAVAKLKELWGEWANNRVVMLYLEIIGGMDPLLLAAELLPEAMRLLSQACEPGHTDWSSQADLDATTLFTRYRAALGQEAKA